MSDKSSFFAELKRRHVYRVGVAYAVAGWLLVQIITQVLPIFHVSELGQRLLVLAVIAGFPLGLVLAWIYDLTPQGIVRTGEAPSTDNAKPSLPDAALSERQDHPAGTFGISVANAATAASKGDSAADIDKARRAQRWTFSAFVLDGQTLELSSQGQVVELSGAALEVLMSLLRRNGEIVTVEELLASAWPGQDAEKSALSGCVTELRQALGDHDETLIRNVQNYGYRLAVPVKTEALAGSASRHFDFKPGDPPPQRPNWSLIECLDAGGHGEVWLARNLKTREERVYKFALDDSCLPSFKREITVSRLLQDSLGARAAAFVRVLEWNLETRPYFIECEYASGGSLARWAEAQGGIENVSLASRIDIVIQIAEAVAAAHSVDVLHKDLKPSNVLINPTRNGNPRVRLCDFGSGGLLDSGRLSSFGITQMGFTRAALQDGQTSGTPVYFPPELLSGQAATKQSDLFSLGVILYQMVIGDLRRPLAPGWELDVDDLPLRRTIALAAAGNPARRLKTVDELVERLRNPPRPAGQAATQELLSIAVLPFLNAGGALENDYLGNSLSEELITSFSRIGGLQVAPKSMVGEYRNVERDPVEIGKALKVQMVVAGELRRERERLHFSVRLIRTEDEEELWSQTCERAFDQLLPLQEEIAQSILAALKIKLPDGRITRPGTDNLPAYDYFLRGKYDWMTQDREINLASIDNLKQAVTLDPAFARSHSQLSLACWTRIYFIDPDDQAALKLGFSAAERALKLNPNLAEAHMARGQLAWTPSARFAYSMAIKEFKRALAVNGRFSPVWGQLSAVYLHIGMFDEAMSAAHRGRDADPADLACNFMIAQIPVWAGNHEEGLDSLERLPREYNPTLWYYATLTSLLALERTHEAEARLDEFFEHHKDKGGLMTGMRARMLAAAGHHDEAEQSIVIADSADRRFGHFHHTAYEIAGAYALMKRRPEAFKYLHEAVHTGYPCCPLIDRDPILESLRGDPEYQKIMEWPRRQCEHFKTL